MSNGAFGGDSEWAAIADLTHCVLFTYAYGGTGDVVGATVVVGAYLHGGTSRGRGSGGGVDHSVWAGIVGT